MAIARADAAPRSAWAVASVLMAMLMVVLGAATASIALPSIAEDLQAAPAESVRVVTAYQLGLLMMLLPAAALGESRGFRQVFVVGTALFVVASLACALSPSLQWLVAARFVQGLGGAAIMALGVALLRLIVPSRRLGAAIGWNALTVALSTAAAPTLGATILTFGSWPWLFVMNVPIGIGVLLAARFLPVGAGDGREIDTAGIALNAVTFAAIVIAAEHAPSAPMRAAFLLLLATAAGALLIRRAAERSAPLVPLDLLRLTSFRVAVIASILCFAGQTAALVALPFYLQRASGLSPFAMGLHLSPWPLAAALAGPIAGRLSDRVPPAWLCLAGGASLAVGLGAAAAWSPSGPMWTFGCFMVLCGFGFGLFNVPNNRNMFLSAPQERSGAAGGLQGIARLTGQTIGTVAMTLLFEFAPLDVAARLGLELGAGLTLAAGIFSIRARARRDTNPIARKSARPAYSP